MAGTAWCQACRAGPTLDLSGCLCILDPCWLTRVYNTLTRWSNGTGRASTSALTVDLQASSTRGGALGIVVEGDLSSRLAALQKDGAVRAVERDGASAVRLRQPGVRLLPGDAGFDIDDGEGAVSEALRRTCAEVAVDGAFVAAQGYGGGMANGCAAAARRVGSGKASSAADAAGNDTDRAARKADRKAQKDARRAEKEAKRAERAQRKEHKRRRKEAKSA